MEFGALMILFAFMAITVLFFYFGIDEKDPSCIILGVAILGAIIIMLSYNKGVWQ